MKVLNEIVIPIEPVGLPFPRYERRGRCNRCGWCCIHEKCEHLSFNGKIATCLIHDDPDRPLKCKLWPEAPPICNPDCGFYFLDTWDNNKVVKRKL